MCGVCGVCVVDGLKEEIKQLRNEISKLRNEINELKSAPPQLTNEIIMQSKWKFYNERGFLGIMGFDGNGKVTDYQQNNEKSWRLTADGILELYDHENKRSAQFIYSTLDQTGKWKLIGPFR